MKTTGELEPFAASLATLFRDVNVRTFLREQLDRSTVKESKVHFQRFLFQLRDASSLTLSPPERLVLDSLLLASSRLKPLELYLPFADQQARWDGKASFQVVAIVGDDDAPVAFETEGQRTVLSKTANPQRMTVVLTPAEQPFEPIAVAFAVCDPNVTDCGGGGGGGGGGAGGGLPSVDTSLYMTRLKIDDDYESIFKGEPEFEVHILGPAGTSDSLRSHQCTGEHAGSPYDFDYNDVNLTWTGNVLLFSATQLAAYRSTYPGKAFRVFVVEDDDDSCILRLDATKAAQMFQTIATNYPAVDGAIDSTFNLVKTVKGAGALYNIISSLASFITTQDDLVGTALEDAVVGQYFSGSNWIIRGPGNATKGPLKLEMKP